MSFFPSFIFRFYIFYYCTLYIYALPTQNIIRDVKDKVSFRGYRVLEITPQNDEDVSLMENLSGSDLFDFWTPLKSPNETFTVAVNATIVDSFNQFLKDRNISALTRIEDLQMLIDSEESSIKEEEEGLNFRDPGFNLYKYHSIEEINEYLTQTSSKNNMVELERIGTTLEKQPIHMIKIVDDSADKFKIVLECGIHAREWVSPSTCLYIIDRLIHDGEAMRSLFDFLIIPVVNPDGYRYSWTKNRMWRKNRNSNNNNDDNNLSILSNLKQTSTFAASYPSLFNQIQSSRQSSCKGVDPNRNFLVGFNSRGSSNNPCSDVYHGSFPFSEEESKAIKRVVENYRIASYVSIHAYSQLWLSPWGYNKEKPNEYQDHLRVMEKSVEALKSVHGTQFKYGNIAKVIYQAGGSTVDWTFKSGIKYSFALELRDKGNYGFILPKSQIQPTVEETWVGLKTMVLEIAKEY